MRPPRRLCGLVAILWASALHASDYQLEGALSYTQGDGDLTEADTTSLRAVWFFAPVKASNAPRAEAGFLSRQSSIRYSYARNETEMDLPPPIFFPAPVGPPLVPIGDFFGRRTPVISLRAVSSSTTELDRHTITYNLVHKASGWFGQIGGSITEGDSDGFSRGDIDGNSYRLSVGRYLTSTTTVRAYVVQDDQKTKTTFSSSCFGLPFCIGVTLRSKVETDALAFGVAAKHVGQAFGHYYTISGFLQHDEADTEISSSTVITENPLNLPITLPPPVTFKSSISDIWKTGVNATWYFNQDLGIGVGYAFSDADTNQDQSYSLEGRWFVTPRVELRLHAMRTHLEGAARDNVDQLGLTISGRF